MPNHTDKTKKAKCVCLNEIHECRHFGLLITVTYLGHSLEPIHICLMEK